MKLLISNITPDNRLLLDEILDSGNFTGVFCDDGSFCSHTFGNKNKGLYVDAAKSLYFASLHLTRNDFKVEILK